MLGCVWKIQRHVSKPHWASLEGHCLFHHYCTMNIQNKSYKVKNNKTFPCLLTGVFMHTYSHLFNKYLSSTLWESVVGEQLCNGALFMSTSSLQARLEPRQSWVSAESLLILLFKNKQTKISHERLCLQWRLPRELLIISWFLIRHEAFLPVTLRIDVIRLQTCLATSSTWLFGSGGSHNSHCSFGVLFDVCKKNHGEQATLAALSFSM